MELKNSWSKKVDIVFSNISRYQQKVQRKMQHIYAIENTIMEACFIVYMNRDGEMSEAEITEEFYKVLERAIAVQIVKVSQDVMEKAITQYGIGRALSDYRGDNVPDVEDLYNVVLRKEVECMIKENEGTIMDYYGTEYLMKRVDA